MGIPSPRLLKAALDYADLGLVAVPLVGRHPPYKGYQRDRDTSAEKTRERFLCNPRADGVAVLTGEGFFIVDLDTGHRPGEDGVQAYCDLIKTHGTVEKAPLVKTPRGGFHAWYRAPSGVRIRNMSGAHALAPGIDVKGDPSGLATCPPTTREHGAYRWIRHVRDVAIPLAPDWLIDLVRAPEPKIIPMPPARVFCGSEHPYARSGFDAALFELSGMAPGSGRNASLFRVGARFFGFAAAGHLPSSSVERALLNAAHANGLVKDDGIDAVAATIASAKRRGFETPRDPPPQEKRGEVATPRPARTAYP